MTAGSGGKKIIRFYLAQIGALEIADRQVAENVINNTGCHFHIIMPLNHAVGLKAVENKSVHIFLKGHTVLEAQRNGNGKTIKQAAESRPFLVHVKKNFTQTAVLVFAGTDKDRMAADFRFLRITHSAVGQGLADSPDIGFFAAGKRLRHIKPLFHHEDHVG